ncbi:DinB family protein [Streptomyces bambusae]|uniref:DinB family protein n=1 Tax=Streptomyces bambusae TaxID=1550616 RepID=UPI001CFFDE4E|nr:DinB family protein [Streptomyces bambusae]MCB5169827.1 DinB family protein [Streptomyces bambusae]
MSASQQKTDLHTYLRTAREALVWKLDGLSEYDVRRPLTPTGTNLLGLVKHAAGVEIGYFGLVFGRPYADPPAWFGEDAEPNADMWATADESREQVLAFARDAWRHADATIEALPLDAPGRVPWWPAERSGTTLHLIMAHVIADLQRHAGHADIVRELVDGSAGLRSGNGNLPPGDAAWWKQHHDRVERAACQAAEAT